METFWFLKEASCEGGRRSTWPEGVYLLDSNVVSELRRIRPHGAVLAWLKGVPDTDLHLSAVSIGEIQRGIEATREHDAAKAAELEAWLEQVSRTFSIIPMDERSFRSWARLMHRRSSDVMEDAMIAATALVHRLTVATRNVRDFQQFGASTVNPFEG